MKKLIKLLNEWLKYKEKFWPDKLTRVTWIDDSWELLFKLKNWCYWSVEYVISKRCEFIKRLVDNDKIWRNKNSDRSAMLDLMRAEVKEQTEVFEWIERYEWYIMILSIQDSPIEFLVSILK